MKDLMKPYRLTPALDKLQYPVLASPKIDGIRCAIENGKARTFNKKPVANTWTRETLEMCADLYEGFDGELVVPGLDFNAVQSAIMSEHGTPNFRFAVFDIHNSTLPYIKRIEEVHKRVADIKRFGDISAISVFAVSPVLCRNQYELAAAWENFIRDGYEGAIAMRPDGLYKNGRSGLREQLSIKLKVWHDDEATVLNVLEEIDASGNYKSRAGALTLQHKNGCVFSVGGLTDELKDLYWKKPELVEGKRVTFKYQDWPEGGKPRFPGFKGIRHD